MDNRQLLALSAMLLSPLFIGVSTATSSTVADDPRRDLRYCPPAARADTDVVVVVAGGRPNQEIWRSVRSQAMGWLSPSPKVQHVRLAVVQHTASDGFAVLTAPESGGFVSSPADLDRVRWEHFNRARSAAPRRPGAGPWRRSQPTVVANTDAVAGLRAAAAALQGLAPAPNTTKLLEPRDAGSVAIRLLVLVTGVASDLLATREPTPAKIRLSQQVFRLQETMQLDFGAAEAAVSAVRTAANKLRRKLLGALRSAPTSMSNSRGNAEMDLLRIGLILDGRGQPAVLRRALYGDASLEDAYKDGREAGLGVTYHRAREYCHKSWHPLCGKGGSLQGRLLHDGTSLRITEYDSTHAQASAKVDLRNEGQFSTPLHWLVPLPRAVLPPCEPRYPWVLPKQQPPIDDDDDDSDDDGDGDGSHNDSTWDGGGNTDGFCQLHSSGSQGSTKDYLDKQKDAEARAASRLSGVADGENIQKMFNGPSSDDALPRHSSTNATGNESVKTEQYDTARTAADVAPWLQQLETMACGSPHSMEPLLETSAMLMFGDTTTRQDNMTGTVSVVDWRVQGKGPGDFTNWAVDQGMPLLIKGTGLSQWVAEHTADPDAGASDNANDEKPSSWSWPALAHRLADYPMLETKRSLQHHQPDDSGASTTASSGEPNSMLSTGSAQSSFFDPDVRRAPMSWSGLVGSAMNGPNQDNHIDSSSSSSRHDGLPYEVYNTTGRELLQKILLQHDDEVVSSSSRERTTLQQARPELVYWFDKLPQTLIPDIASVAGDLFLRESDLKRYEQYIWFSSAGVQMHTHVDADHNFFLQISGRKRWTLYPSAEAAEMHPFPRTHPLWHKAQRLPFASHPTARFPDSTSPGTPLVIDVEPGDVLYVPPYTWHSVATLSPSISLSSWSDFANVRTLMTHLYRAQPHEFDSLVRRRGRLFALRTYIATLLHGIHGPSPAAAQAWIERHLSSRYRGLEHLFPSAFANITAEEYIPRLPIRCRNAPRVGKCAVVIGEGNMIPASQICDNPAHPGMIPIDETLAQELQFQADTANNVLLNLPSPEVRELLLSDYIDELVADVVGAERSYAFLRYCFREQGYLVTRCDTQVCHAESALWGDYSSPHPGRN